MKESKDIGQQKRTFRLELVRSLPQGVIETASTTFAMYVAIRVFDASVFMKMAIAASASIGLLLSLFTVQIIRRLNGSVNIASVVIWCIAALGFAISALAGSSSTVYMIGVCLAAMMLTAGAPLISQIYRNHYGNEVRGRLFSYAGLLKSSAGALAGIFIGAWLVQQGSDYHGVFWFYAGCCIIMAICVFAMARVSLTRTSSLQLFDAFKHVSHDKPFRKLLITWMILGLGNLLCYALFVEYITNPTYGFNLAADKAGWVTTTIPMLVYVLCIIPWGMVFDKIPFYRLRVLVNLFFLAGVLIYFLGGNYLSLCIGMAFYGIGKAGGNILWSLWVTRFAHEDKVGEYMSVHTFLTGFRGTLAPIISFTLVGSVGTNVVAITGASLMALSSLMLLPEIISEFRQGTGAIKN
ncbi:MAG: MFS transporter [Akkermansiaceae bacterium]